MSELKDMPIWEVLASREGKTVRIAMTPAESEEEALKTISGVPWGDEVNAESITVRKLDE
jgi:hypothetical protein